MGWLVLSRRRGEALEVRVPGRDRPVVVKVARVGTRQVRLAVLADPDIAVDRCEVAAARAERLARGEVIT